MNIFQVISNLYTNRSTKWIVDIEETTIAPFVIQKWLCMNDRLRIQTRWLDKYIFVLTPKQYLSLAWSIIPKENKAPFVKYIKKQDESVEFDFILTKVRQQFKLSDNDFRAVRGLIINAIKKDMIPWFGYYGVPKKFWKKHYLDFNKIKEIGPKIEKKPQGLAAFGM